MNLVENFLDGAILTVFIYLLITVIWQWLEKKITGERTYVFWYDIVAIVTSVVLAIVLSLFNNIAIVELIIALISVVAQITILVLIWKAVVELIALRKINKLLENQIEVKDRQISTQRLTIDELFRIVKEQDKKKENL
ncbi:hypothetical protein [Mammaliicoccus lentus]|uniref:hypothetical protein n=1 Tax=Mammaliicoccus lentus TaxID=42858 RepID=UPI001072D862|nr:hypothetical protein [Mammaliicoccus lentus]MBF0793355.1 hypothetical protein [Mammaliicoccus lentus]TFV17856.1 hypothetical protein E4T78_01730 [Mammaliicoccus lentus]